MWTCFIAVFSNNIAIAYFPNITFQTPKHIFAKVEHLKTLKG